MNNLMLTIFVKTQTLLASDEGQDLIEYALLISLVAFGAVLSLKSIGSQLGDLFNDINKTLANTLPGRD